MAKTHVINGVNYVEVDRKADVGEKVIVVKSTDFPTGFISEVVALHPDSDGSVYLAKNFRGVTFIDSDFEEYLVLEPLEEPTVDGTQASPAVIDMLANLARRVTQLESQLAATQRNLETFAEQTESIKYLAESNEQDIAMLDERTQVINAITKFYGGGRR